MSYPPPGGYGYPPQNTGYPQQQQPGMGYGVNPNGGGMPMPGGAPGYGQPGYGQPSPYPAGGGMPMPGQPAPSMQSMGFAATAAVNFRPSTYPNQPFAVNPPQPAGPYGGATYGAMPAPPAAPYGGASYGAMPAPPAAYGGTPQQPQQSYQPSPSSTGSVYQGGQQQQPATKPTITPLKQVPREPATQGTITDFKSFEPQRDAELLRKAMKGFGTDEKAITQIVGSRSNKQRQQIKLEFATLYGKDLIKELKGELSSNYETAVVALFMPPDEYDAYQMFKAMEGAGTDEKALIEILCTRTNAQIQAAASAFKKLYKKDLEKEISSETSGHFRRLLVSLCQGSRLENSPLDNRKAAEDAQALYQAGEARWGTDESRFNVVLACRSFPQLRLTFDEYQKISKRTLEKAISSEMSGDLKDGMKSIVKCARNRAAYFAERLHWSMKGLGTDDKTLIRIMVSRSEIDMVQIKNEFQKLYGKTLASFIADDCSGDYKKLLILICGH